MDIIVLANTVLVRGGISGGDIVLPHINNYWKGRFRLKVITTLQGKAVWESIPSEKEFFLLPYLKYEGLELKITFLATYILRTIFAFPILNKIINREKNEKRILFSASDFFPDVLPAFFARKRKNIFWFARVYHIIKSPYERKGNRLVNLLSYLLQKASLKLINAKADKILTPVGTYKELRELGIAPEKIIINNPGVDLELIDPLKPADKKYDAIFIGALLFNKGSYDIVNIWEKVTRKISRAKLAVIGGGPKKEIAYFRKTIEDAGLKQNIEYMGFVKDIRDVYSLLKSSKILILTGHENGWSIPVSEAFACGIPVIAYNLKMFGTAFKQGFITVPLHNTDKFAGEIINILNDGLLRDSLSKKAYEEGRNLGWDKVAEDLAVQIDDFIKLK